MFYDILHQLENASLHLFTEGPLCAKICAKAVRKMQRLKVIHSNMCSRNWGEITAMNNARERMRQAELGRGK
jgi:hypothetical protein